LENERFAMVPGVGYPNPNRSHFESMAIWHTAASIPRTATAWAGLDEGAGFSVATNIVTVSASVAALAKGPGITMTLITFKIVTATTLTVLIASAGVIASGPWLAKGKVVVDRQKTGPADGKRAAEPKDKETPQDKKAKGYLGIKLRSDEDSGAVVVHEVIADSPAAKAGFQEEDVILKVGNVEAKNRDTVVKAVAGLKPGEKVTIRFKRDGKEMSYSVIAESLAPTKERQALRKELEAKCAKLEEAFKKKDIKMLTEDSGSTSDFSLTFLNGKTATREELQEGLKQRMDRIKSVNHLKIELGNITVTEDKAVVITTQNFSRVITGPDGKDHTVVTSGTTHRETYVKTPQGWKIKHVEEIKQGKETVDGEPTKRP
jgi:membrane-associated protease RseP (regulator of RpoE activity)